MRTREVEVPWSEMQENDKFLRYAERDPSDKVIVEREVPDLPTVLNAMGYATVLLHGRTHEHMLVIRVRTAGAHRSWMSPYIEDATDRWLTEDQIVGFMRMDLVPVVDRRTMEDAIIDGSGSTRQRLEFVGVNVRGIYNAVANLLYPPSE